jgi:hypothetical protein
MKNYIIALKISKNLLGSFWTIKTVAARLLHAPPPLAVRGFTRCCKRKNRG